LEIFEKVEDPDIDPIYLFKFHNLPTFGISYVSHDDDLLIAFLLENNTEINDLFYPSYFGGE
jgi:hypothetical protein